MLDGLVALTGAPGYRESGTRTYRDVMLLEAGCLGRSLAQCHLQGTTAEGQLGRETFIAKSVVATRALSTDAIGVLVDSVGSVLGRTDLGGVAVLLDSLGGAVARVAPSETAFVHRGAFAIAQLYASWEDGRIKLFLTHAALQARNEGDLRGEENEREERHAPLEEQHVDEDGQENAALQEGFGDAHADE